MVTLRPQISVKLGPFAMASPPPSMPHSGSVSPAHSLGPKPSSHRWQVWAAAGPNLTLRTGGVH